MAKKQYRVRNGSDYNESLVQRGNITFWFDEEVIKSWHKLKQAPSRGRPCLYSDTAIEGALTLRSLFRLPLRATEGLIKSLLSLGKLPLLTPDIQQCVSAKRRLRLSFPVTAIRQGKGCIL